MTFNLAEAYRSTRPKIDLMYLLFLSAFHIGAVAAIFYFSWANLLAFFVMYVISGIGITVGYHRLLTHKSFLVPKWVEYIFAVMGNIGMEGSPVTWVAHHRQHHKESDTDLDPHNIHKGFWHAHMLWVFMRYPGWYEKGQKELFAPDLQRDGFYRWLDKYHYLFPILIGVLFFVVGGLGLFLWAFCLRTVAMYHSTWFVNSAAHYWGYRPFKEEIATNNWWVAILALGEGWHNNHHKFPTSAKHGLRAWEIDPSWILIWTMKKLRIAKKVKQPSPEELPWKKAKTRSIIPSVVNTSFEQ
jgi:fatty-acid desaturase